MRDLDAGGAFGVILLVFCFALFCLRFMCFVVYVHTERVGEREERSVWDDNASNVIDGMGWVKVVAGILIDRSKQWYLGAEH